MILNLSLFSGIGGLDLAAEWTGKIHTYVVCDNHAVARKYLKRNFPSARLFKNVKDVTKVQFRRFDLPSPDLITAGFPCQPFSFEGKRLGTRDHRYLWPETFSVITEFKPRWVVLENVKGLLSCEEGKPFRTILENLSAMGYVCWWQTYGHDEASVFGSQRRDRVFIVGLLADYQNENRGNESRIVYGKEPAHISDLKSSITRQSRTPIPRPRALQDWQKLLEKEPYLLPCYPSQDETSVSIRTAINGVTARMAMRLLGNLVAPDQAYPIFDTITKLDEELFPEKPTTQIKDLTYHTPIYRSRRSLGKGKKR